MPATLTATRLPTIADMVVRLGGIPLDRILLEPAPGKATDADLLELVQERSGLFELVDGTIVEKAMGFEESFLTVDLAELISAFVRKHRLGKVTGPDGVLRLHPGLSRAPDIAFISWKRFPGGRLPKAKIPDLVPDLAVEVISESNTPAEMKRKREEYLRYGVRLVWIIDPERRTVQVFAPRRKPALLCSSDTLEGGNVLPGLSIDLKKLFATLDESADG